MRRLKTPEELRADLKLFEAAWKRESAKVMRNAVERMIAGGRRVPARYRMKLPRFTKTVLVPPPVAPGNPVLLTDQPHPPSARWRKPSTERQPKRRAEAAEYREMRESVENAVDGMQAFSDGRLLPPPCDVTASESADFSEAQSFLDAARLAHLKLLNHLKELK